MYLAEAELLSSFSSSISPMPFPKLTFNTSQTVPHLLRQISRHLFPTRLQTTATCTSPNLADQGYCHVTIMHQNKTWFCRHFAREPRNVAEILSTHRCFSPLGRLLQISISSQVWHGTIRPGFVEPNQCKEFKWIRGIKFHILSNR